jgi:hypothetical protein
MFTSTDGSLIAVVTALAIYKRLAIRCQVVQIGQVLQAAHARVYFSEQVIILNLEVLCGGAGDFDHHA